MTDESDDSAFWDDPEMAEVWGPAIDAMFDGDLKPFADTWRTKGSLPEYMRNAFFTLVREDHFAPGPCADNLSMSLGQEKARSKEARDNEIGAWLAVRIWNGKRGEKARLLAQAASKFCCSESLANQIYKDFRKREFDPFSDHFRAYVQARSHWLDERGLTLEEWRGRAWDKK